MKIFVIAVVSFLLLICFSALLLADHAAGPVHQAQFQPVSMSAALGGGCADGACDVRRGEHTRSAIKTAVITTGKIAAVAAKAPRRVAAGVKVAGRVACKIVGCQRRAERRAARQ